MTRQKYPHVNTANRYARDIVSGKIPACEFVKLACQRHLNDLKREKNKNFIYRFDRAAGEKICVFAELLPHVKGKWAGQNIQLQPWQCFILAVLFGWLKKSDGLRRFIEFYDEVPRKNGKSIIGAVISLYMFCADGEPGAEVYSGATTEKQAWEVFRPAKLMVERTPALREHYGIEVCAKNLHSIESGSRFEPLIGKPGDGSSPHCSIVDEYHEHKTPDLHDTMKTGQGARTQPMLGVITTGGVNLQCPCYDKRNEAIKVLRGEIENDELFAIIYTIDDSDDWEDFDNWIKANPNYGVSVNKEFLARQHRDALQIASKQNILRCKHLNQWMNADVAWMNMAELRKCADTSLEISQVSHLPCYVGLDLASKIDIAGMIFVFVDDKDIYAFWKNYLPKQTIDRPENRHYQTWRHEDRIIETGQAVTDYALIESDLLEAAAIFNIEAIAYDPFQATQFFTRMDSVGLPMVEVRNTVLNFSEPMKELEARIMSGKFHYDGDPVATWFFSNVVAHTDKKDNIFPHKEFAQNKIDGVVSLIMAMNRILVGPEENEEIENAFREL